MDAKDIMLGDWLRLRYKHHETGEEIVKDFQVTQLRKMTCSTYAWSEEDGNMGKVENLEPIPLTPEILEKNGNSHNHLWFRIEGCHFSLYKSPDGSYSVEFFDDLEMCYFEVLTIRFVHELQHALRLCGIDKEIVL